MEEFFLQGDEEKKLGLAVSPNMDRETSDQYQISIGFIEFLTRPFFEALAELLPAISEMADNINQNCERWKKMQEEAHESPRSDSAPDISFSSATIRPHELSTMEPSHPEDPLTVNTAIAFPSDVISPITAPATASPLKTARSSFSSTEPRRKRSSASSHLSAYDDRRLSTAAGVVDVPNDDWWEKHRTMRRLSSSHGRGLAALQSFTNFLDWKRAHTGASTPNLLALNEGGEEDEGDVLQAIHWYGSKEASEPAEPVEVEVPKERRLSRTGVPVHLRGVLQRSASVDTANIVKSKSPWSPRK